jgi:hypothetical protein
LRERFFIVVLKPELSNTTRRLPFERFRVTSVVSPVLDNPDTPANFVTSDGLSFWPHVALSDHMWNLTTTDSGGQGLSSQCRSRSSTEPR